MGGPLLKVDRRESAESTYWSVDTSEDANVKNFEYTGRLDGAVHISGRLG